MEHASDCALHNEPATKAGPCDCGAVRPDREKSTRAILEDAMANKPDPLATAYARIELLEGLLREAEPYTPQSFSGKPLLANRIQEALRKVEESNV